MAISLKEKFRTILKLVSEPRVLKSLISLRAFGYLLDIGWFNSFKSGEPVDRNNKPIPWFTYPAIEFLSGKLNKRMTIFEFGSGNSTLFFSERVNQITSVEHNRTWYNKVVERKPENSRIELVISVKPEDYIGVINLNFNKYDIIIVDGLYRNECLIESKDHLSESGVLILDDSDRIEYQTGINNLLEEGFKRLDFWGISPGYLYQKDTSIFYKGNNCLNI